VALFALYLVALIVVYWVALFDCISHPLYIFLYFITNKLNKKTERNVMVQSAELESQLVESLNTMSTIKRFGIEDFIGFKTENRFVKLLNTGYTSGLNGAFVNYSTFFFSRLFSIIVLWIGSYFVLSQNLTPGELLSFYAILGYFSGPLNSIITVNQTIQNAFIASDRLFEIMDLDQEKQNKIILQKDMLGDIKFQNVSFRYGSRIDVFKDFNLLITQGEITAIVGESGSGKSTLIHLLQNIYPLASGKIYINNIDIKQFDNHSLRKMVGVIPQKVELFKGNIIENISVGEFEPDMNKILKISQDIGLIKFIEELPEGFFTDIGENGTSLSGGQRQKIAFARVLYREPEILILDEASSSLDSESEEQIMNVIHRLKEQGKTIIMIAHRLSTVLNADVIIVLENGVVIENGSHTELYKNKQKYYNLWQKQIPDLQS